MGFIRRNLSNNVRIHDMVITFLAHVAPKGEGDIRIIDLILDGLSLAKDDRVAALLITAFRKVAQKVIPMLCRDCLRWFPARHTVFPIFGTHSPI